MITNNSISQTSLNALGICTEPDKTTITRFKNQLVYCIAKLDRLIASQLKQITQHNDLQRLQSAWIGLQLLTDEANHPDANNILIKALPITWKEISKDTQSSLEFDQTTLFEKVYEDEFGSPGGKPFGIMLVDYSVNIRGPNPIFKTNDIAILNVLAEIGSASFCPFILQAAPQCFGVDDYKNFKITLNTKELFTSKPYQKWNNLRENSSLNFLGLMASSTLEISRISQIHVTYVFIATVLKAYIKKQWLTSLQQEHFNINRQTYLSNVITRNQTDIIKHLGFFSPTSLGSTILFDNTATTFHAIRSENTPYTLGDILSVAHFAHYVKMIGRHEIGQVKSIQALQRKLNNWATRYISPQKSTSAQGFCQHPFSHISIEVKPDINSTSHVQCTISLTPHTENNSTHSHITLNTQI